MFERIFPQADLDFAREIANKIARHYPVSVEAKLKTVGGKKRLSSVVESVFDELERYQAQSRMGWMRKARFGNELKWRLKEVGYSEEFVDALTEGVVTHLAMSGRQQAKSK